MKHQRAIIEGIPDTNFVIDGNPINDALKEHSSFNFTWRFIHKNGI